MTSTDSKGQNSRQAGQINESSSRRIAAADFLRRLEGEVKKLVERRGV
jgi:hypothetical protein